MMIFNNSLSSFIVTFIMLTLVAICIEGAYTSDKVKSDMALKRTYVKELKKVTAMLEEMKNSGKFSGQSDRSKLIGLEVQSDNLRDEIEEIDNKLQAMGFFSGDDRLGDE